jgi:CDP-glycerol glycerophosphotransferase (TagB/SpsB family)
MKKIGLDDKYSAVHSFFQQVIVKHLFPFAYEYTFDYVVSNAQIFSIDMASAFGVNADRILETGSPRNDAFFRDKFEDFHQHLKNEFIDAKIVYYLPTFRNHKSAVSLFDLSDFDRSKLEKFLNKENIVLISKGHFVDNKLVEENFHGKHSRLIHLVNDQVDDINLLLKDADALITDYSGAYFDFLLTERPIIFAAFDYEAYVSESRELYFNYAEIVSGPIVKNWTELYHAMCFLWEEDNKLLSSKDKNSIFNKYHDGDNSKRLFKKIQQI